MRVGIENLLQKPKWLQGRKVALLSHQAAICSDGSSSAQLLYRALGKNLVALFGPEHGFFGQSGPGEKTYSRLHPDWKIPVHSLYGEFRKPSAEMLRGIDLLVIDLQDLGMRCYTYLASLKLVLEACAENGVAVIVTDRPIPFPAVVDGPVAVPAFFSFVAPCAIPMAYGMTLAESARWLVREENLSLDFKVSKMQGWHARNIGWQDSYPSFVPPSPAIKCWETARIYPATVFTEAMPGIDCGRGTNLVFRVLGAPWLHAEAFTARMEKLAVPGLSCHPYRYAAASERYAERELDGVRLTVTDPQTFHPIQASIQLIRALQAEGGMARVWRHKGIRGIWFDKLYGNSETRQAMILGKSPDEIFATWKSESEEYLKSRKNALLYSRS